MSNHRTPKDPRLHVENINRHYRDPEYLSRRLKRRIERIKLIKKKYGAVSTEEAPATTESQ